MPDFPTPPGPCGVPGHTSAGLARSALDDTLHCVDCLRGEIRAALESAEEEDVAWYRGTDMPRAFVVRLRRALDGRE